MKNKHVIKALVLSTIIFATLGSFTSCKKVDNHYITVTKDSIVTKDSLVTSLSDTFICVAITQDWKVNIDSVLLPGGYSIDTSYYNVIATNLPQADSIMISLYYIPYHYMIYNSGQQFTVTNCYLK